ncbi:MAG: hypothetical protein AB1603_07370 [Chloroflexota bacterium]
MSQQGRRGLILRIAMVWLGLLLLAGFGLGLERIGGPLEGTVFPQVPRQGEPVVVRFELENPLSHASWVEYRLYADGELVLDGRRLLPALSSQHLEYVRRSEVGLQRQEVFVLRTNTGWGRYDSVLATPPYPPQVMSSIASFASFASFSFSSSSSFSATSVLVTREYYEGSFGVSGANIGLLLSLVLLAMLLLLEMVGPARGKDTVTVLGRLRLNFGWLSTVLLLIFLGMVFTRVMLIVWASMGI